MSSCTFIDLAGPSVVELSTILAMSEMDRKSLTRYVKVTQLQRDRAILEARSRFAGRLKVGPLDLWLPPDCGPSAFVQLYLMHAGVSSSALRTVNAVAATPLSGRESVQAALTQLLLAESEAILRHHVSQSYVRKTVRMATLRGRVKWPDPLAFVPPGSVLCTHLEKSTDNLANRLVVAGLEAADRWAMGSPQLAAPLAVAKSRWLSLATPTAPTWRQFDITLEKLDRQTVHYRDALLASRSVIFGVDANVADEALATGVLDLASAFETLISRLLSLALQGSDTRYTAQSVDPGAFRFQDGRPYLKPRPDFVISRGGDPLTIVDAKYKPHYCRASERGARSNRISSEDLYQMSLYGLRRLKTTPEGRRVFIVAPVLQGAAPPEREQRQVRLRIADAQKLTIELVPIPLSDAISIVAMGSVGDARELLSSVLAEAEAGIPV